MGNKSGLDFIGKLREKDEYRNIPVFVVSNTGGHDKEETYLKLGATKYYVKVASRLDDIVADIKETITALNAEAKSD